MSNDALLKRENYQSKLYLYKSSS